MKRVAALAFAALLAAPCFALDLVVPAYFYPAGKKNPWPQLAVAAARAPLVAILNPASGPGTFTDPNYTAAIAGVRSAGGRVIAYVSTRYATRPLIEVTADINAYLGMYAVDGFFLDEMTNDADAGHLAFYQSAYNYIKALNPAYHVMGNPGTNTQEAYASLPVADSFVVFEGNATSYSAYVPAAWQAGYARSRFVHIVYKSDKKQMAKDVANAVARGAGGLFVTSDKLPNPYDVLPSYWKDEVTEVGAAP
ncbi:spherulation-specific family 4 protein [Ramlibacter sp. PS4R-6]|uniref:spherulation-specific family 4 protein n=1 Tax=Ramlibacter sp. PS4R-6 TaxID=3133438 RepID=UPI0030ADC065